MQWLPLPGDVEGFQGEVTPKLVLIKKCWGALQVGETACANKYLGP